MARLNDSLKNLGKKLTGNEIESEKLVDIINETADNFNGGLEEQVQADWNENDTEAKGYIKNKPITLPAVTDDKTYALKLVNGVLTWVEETA